jgi:hypothetical protein
LKVARGDVAFDSGLKKDSPWKTPHHTVLHSVEDDFLGLFVSFRGFDLSEAGLEMQFA